MCIHWYKGTKIPFQPHKTGLARRAGPVLYSGFISNLGLSVYLKRKHLCNPYQHGGEAAGYDSPVGCQRYLTLTKVGHDLTSPLSVNPTSGGLKTFFQRF